MNTFDMKRWLTVILVACSLLWTPAAKAATPSGWKDTGLSINANGMSLRDVLNEFGRTYGVRLASSVSDGRMVRGRLKADSGTEFMDRLAQEYKFRWFVYNDTLHVVPRDDNTSMRLEVGEDAVQDAKAALIGLGLFDSRFGWGELPDEGVVIVSGPRAYVDLARGVLMPSKEKEVQKGKQIMLFRLKYASATDRVINTRGQSETIPGVKSILNGLLLGPESPEKLSSGHGKFDAASGKRSREEKTGRGMAQEVDTYGASSKVRAARDSEDDGGNERAAKARKAARDDHPRIEANPALNAIMIYDNVNKREMYKALIAELDVEPQQVEIEALIVDIDRSQLSELGVEWSVRSGNTVATMNSTMADSLGTDLPLPGATLLISNAARFYARLKALEGRGQAHVLAKPTVLTLDNVAAVLDLSQTAYVSLVGERVADLASVSAGTMLRVVPRIVHEGDNTRVRLEVDIEDGALNDPSLKSGVTRSTISTQAIVDMQQTLMIGGYHAESVTNNLQKVPLLGDVPVVGNLFRSTTENHSTRERLFLITPRLTGSTGTPAPTRSKVSRVGQKVIKEDNSGVTRLPESLNLDYERDGKTMPPAALATPAAPVSRSEASSPRPESGSAPVVQPASLRMTDSIGAGTQQAPAKRKCARPKGTPLVPLKPA
ncbi:EscC/YscC/HrcC family type III secretion system outer membrane ring protein [Noviherbaspirillum cavernae]|uniref:Type 3 secretion system secretin n=2 Tax=Noviherbaspirillum cavernae TaxID=2320862 RepID=A0A418WWI9_9BURK|nr:EscC/YscC/HrcC family type III secretion system outer membrane ring protein [Noviherbaspirillum cavernae]